MTKEFEIIEQVFRRRVRTSSDVTLGIGDDAALTRLPHGQELVTATDALVAGTHFLADAPARSVGHRCLAVNLSDIAAMGAQPLWASLTLSLPLADRSWLDQFADGFFALAEQHRVTLIGGDTVRGGLFAALTLQGSVPEGQGIMRAGAAAGDLIYVTGHVGDAAAGRMLASAEMALTGSAGAADFLIKRFYYPTPRVQAGRALRGLATAMIDISDGLHADLGRLLQASSAGAIVDVAAIPVSEALLEIADQSRVVELAMCGGEDYELCFTVAPDRTAELNSVAERWDCRLTCLGAVTAGAALEWNLDGQRYSVPDSGFEHFA